MLTMAPPPAFSMAGSIARVTKNMPRTLMSKERSQSASLQSRMLPISTKPAQFTRMSTGPVSPTIVSTSRRSVTSRCRTEVAGSPSKSCSIDSLMSVAQTFAPSAANAIAVARPIPWAAAVSCAPDTLGRGGDKSRLTFKPSAHAPRPLRIVQSISATSSRLGQPIRSAN